MAHNFSNEELVKYQSEFSETKFWDKIKKVAKTAGRKVVEMALLLFYVLQSPDTPTEYKTIIIGALGYLILPVDLIPDFIPVLGFTDDAAALAAAVKTIQSCITPEIEARAKAKASDWL